MSQKKKYDVIIVGGGPAGLSCAINLSKHGKSALILEKNKSLQGKVCGDGLTFRAIELLMDIGIDPTLLEGKIVHSKATYKNGKCSVSKYIELFNVPFYMGVSRDLLTDYMLNYALSLGVEISWNHECRDISLQKNEFIVDNLYQANDIILACGAGGRKTFDNHFPKDLPIGMSARIRSSCSYSDEMFHFFYDEKYGDGYAWLFPVGDKTWNLGVYGYKRKTISSLYTDFEKIIVGNTPMEYIRAPKAALIGATKEKHTNCLAYYLVGDCAFSAKYESGEGISFAIEDGIYAASHILKIKSNRLLERSECIHPLENHISLKK